MTMTSYNVTANIFLKSLNVVELAPKLEIKSCALHKNMNIFFIALELIGLYFVMPYL